MLAAAYDSLGRGDAGPLLSLLGDDFEWEEPALPGYPLSGVHRGAEGFATGVLASLAELLEGLTFTVSEVVSAPDRAVVCGVMHGVPAGGDEEWELPFAHVWTLAGAEAETPVRAVAYFDRSRLTLAASRRQLADVADELLDQAAEIRQQWDRLGDALRAAGVEATSDGDEELPVEETAASARLVVVDMASEGASREEVEQYLREELGVEDPEPLLAEVFDGVAGEPAPSSDPRPGSLDPSRLTKLFARNRS